MLPSFSLRRRRPTRRLILTASLTLVLAGTGLASTSIRRPLTVSVPPAAAAIVPTTLPLAFEPNQGQSDPSVHFLARSREGTVFFTDTGFTVLTASGRSISLQAQGSTAVAGEGTDPLPGTVSYFSGTDPAQWKAGIPTYSRLRYTGIYPGIDLAYYGKEGQLEHDFIVAPGARPEQIAWLVSGADTVRLADNRVALAVGERTLYLDTPTVYQEYNGNRQLVESRYSLTDHRISFTLGEYDRDRPLVIDPVLQFSSYLGGDNFDRAYGVTIDGEGSLYITGDTLSGNYPATGSRLGAAGYYDAFITKVNATGSAVVYSVVLASSGNDRGADIAVNSDGEVYVVGTAGSTGFPTTASAFQKTSGVYDDAFVAKLNSTGTGLLYATYLGGSGTDSGKGIAIDGTGQAYITGETNSANFPTRAANQSTLKGGSDAFTAKLNASGSDLIFSTYHGGIYADSGNSLDVDAAGNAYIGGSTTSPDLPLLVAAQPTFGGVSDGFVLKYDTSGTLRYATYLGGSSGDSVDALAVDGTGFAYVTGSSSSNNFPRQNAYDSTYNLYGDAFVSKLASDGSSLMYSTYLGGNQADRAHGIVVDGSGGTYIIGRTASLNFPVFQATQGTHGGGVSDVFITGLNASGTALTYSSFYGGNGTDIGWAIDAVPDGSAVVIAGETNSTNLPLVGAFQPAIASGFAMPDGFLARISGLGSPAPAAQLSLSLATDRSTAYKGETVTYTLTVSNTGNAAAAPVRFTAPIDSGTTLVTAPSGAVLSGSSLLWTISSIPAGSSGITYTYSVRIN
jgi:uncharacterized repeat protein (TIGR01451 family)